MDYKLNQIDSGLAPAGEVDCYTMESTSLVTAGLGWGQACSTRPSSDSIRELGDKIVYDFEIIGEETSQLPEDDIRLVAEQAEPVYLYPSDNNLASDDLTVDAGGSDGDWRSDADLAVGSLNSCTPDCDFGQLHVEIKLDPLEDEEDCEPFLPEIDVCIDWKYTNAKRSASLHSTCEAGFGTFELYPYRFINKDKDSSKSVVLRAIQRDGTGVMTGAAWIRKINITEDQGLPIRVVRANKFYRFNETDALVNANYVSYLLDAQNENNYLNGMVSGGAPFLLTEVPNTTTAHFMAELEWTCGALLPSEEIQPSQGYTLTPSNICTGDWPQKVTIRPIPFTGASKLHIELYGQLTDHISLPLTDTGNGKSFAYQKGELVIEGTLLSYDSQNGASIQLDKAEIAGVSVCTTGTYLIPPEN